MIKRVGLFLLVLALAVVLGGWITRPPTLQAPKQIVTPGTDIAAFLASSEESERQRFGITPGAEKRVLWAGEPGVKTDYVVVNLHGFSATRQEIAPVAENVAKALDANLFETRLTAHGREREQLANVPAEAWLADGAEALAVGEALGSRLVVMGTSTGATLALAMAEHPQFASIDSLILISPNFGPKSDNGGIATGPYGPQLTRLFAGEYKEWQPANEAQARYWSTRYPTTAVVQMMRLVELAWRQTPRALVPNSLLIYSPKDDVISVDRLLEGYALLPAEHKQIHRVDSPKGLSPHVLSGDILAPTETAGTAALIADFVRKAPAS